MLPAVILLLQLHLPKFQKVPHPILLNNRPYKPILLYLPHFKLFTNRAILIHLLCLESCGGNLFCPLLFLPFVYFLPENLIAKCPTLRTLPRKIREVVYSGELRAIVESDSFFSKIADASAAMAFPHFGFSGWKEHYTGYCPVWKLCYMLPVWARLLEAEIGWGLQKLFYIPSTQTIPFFTPEYTQEVMERIVKRAIREKNWQPTLDMVREMPCDEDF